MQGEIKKAKMRRSILFVLMLSVFLSGCQHNEKSKTTELQENSTTTELQEGNKTTELQETNINDEELNDSRWTTEIRIDSDRMTGIKIDAEVDVNNMPQHVITAKEVYFTDEYMQEQNEILGSAYAVDFMDYNQADTDVEREWIGEYGEGNGYRRKCVQWTMKDIATTACTLSQEDAEKQAKEIVAALQIPYMELQRSEKKQVSLNAGDTQEMYVVRFVPYVDGNLLFYEQNEQAFIHLTDNDGYAPDISVEVYVTDGGIVRVRYNNPLEFVEETEIEEYLSVEEAKELIIEKILANPDMISTMQLTGGYVKLNDFHIEYQRIQQSEDTFIYVPCYVLCKETKWNEWIEYQNFIAVDVRKK